MSKYSDNLKESEKKCIHAKITRNDYNPETGKLMTEPFNQIFTEPEFRNFETYAARLGYSIELLHDPRKKKTDAPKDLDKDDLSIARQEYESYFGRKAHTQKSAENIRKEIAEAQEYDSVLKQWQKLLGVKTTPHISKDEMLEDIRQIKLKNKTTQQIHDAQKEKQEKQIEKQVKENAERQKSE